MKLYVGNLSFQITEQELRDTFSQYGTVTDAALILDRDTQRPRGFGFVTMSTAEEGQRAIEGLHGQNVGGRDITVNEARPMEPRGGGGGGGFRGGFNKGGGGGHRGGGRERGRY